MCVNVYVLCCVGVYLCDISISIRRYRSTPSFSLPSFGIIPAEDRFFFFFFYFLIHVCRSISLGCARSHDLSGFFSHKLVLSYIHSTFINVRIYILYISCHIYILQRVCLFYRYFTRRYHGYLYYFFFAIYVRDNIDLAIVYRHMIL